MMSRRSLLAFDETIEMGGRKEEEETRGGGGEGDSGESQCIGRFVQDSDGFTNWIA